MLDRRSLHNDFTEVVVQLMYRQQVEDGTGTANMSATGILAIEKAAQVEYCHNPIFRAGADRIVAMLMECVIANEAGRSIRDKSYQKEKRMDLLARLNDLCVLGMSITRVAPTEFFIQSCRVCGCTDANCSGCIEKTGEPCHWIEKDLCSACIGKEGP